MFKKKYAQGVKKSGIAPGRPAKIEQKLNACELH